jgi:hypothetical protein
LVSVIGSSAGVPADGVSPERSVLSSNSKHVTLAARAFADRPVGFPAAFRIGTAHYETRF